MRKVLRIISFLALLMTIVPSILFLGGSMDIGSVKCLMLAAAAAWFVITPFWMWREEGSNGS